MLLHILTIEQVQYAWIWWIIPLLSGLCGILIAALSDKDATNIVILGLPASGKTTLFKKLGALIDNGSQVNTPIRDIAKFTFKRSNGDVVTVEKTKDLGGQDEYVKEYDAIIEKESTFIYFVLKMDDLYPNNSFTISHEKKYMLPIVSRLGKINKIIKDKHIEKTGLGFIITHFDEYKKINPTASKEVIESDLRYNFRLKKESIVLIGNLLDDSFISQIKDRIGIKNEQ